MTDIQHTINGSKFYSLYWKTYFLFVITLLKCYYYLFYKHFCLKWFNYALDWFKLFNLICAFGFIYVIIDLNSEIQIFHHGQSSMVNIGELHLITSEWYNILFSYKFSEHKHFRGNKKPTCYLLRNVDSYYNVNSKKKK